MLEPILPLLDDLDRALAELPERLADDPWVRGMGLTRSRLGEVERRLGIERIGTPGEPFDAARHEALIYEPDAVEKHLSSGDLADHMAALVQALDAASPFDEAQIEAAVRGTASARGLKAGALIHATRVAVTGRTQSPGLFEVLAWLGRERTQARLVRLLEFLSTRV